MTRKMCIGAVVLALSLQACGGGGGSGGGGNTGGGGQQSSQPFTLSTTDVRVTADTLNQQPAFASIDVNVTSGSVSAAIGGSFTNNGIWEVGVQGGAPHGTLNVRFRDPATLAPGTYDDSIRVQLCSDSTCTNPIGSPQTISTHYTITGTAVPRPQVTVGTLSLNLQTLPFVTEPQSNIPLTVSNIDTIRLLDKSSTTHNAVFSASYVGSGGNVAVMAIVFKPDLPIGTYQDVVTVALCNNDTYACQESIRGSGTTVTVSLTVSNTITGPNGYTVSFAPVSANGLAWDSGRGVIYAATRDDGSIATIDPNTGSVLSRTLVGGGPNKLGIANDGSFLYVGRDASSTVTRYKLPSMQSDLELPLPPPTNVTDTSRARDIEPSPVDGHTVAIAVGKPSAFTPNCRAVMLFDDAQLRASLPGIGSDASPCINSIQWNAAADTLYTDDDGSFPCDLYALAVGTNSLTSTRIAEGNSLELQGPIRYRNGVIMTWGGVFFDVASRTTLAQLIGPPNMRPAALVYSSEAHRAFAVQEYFSGQGGLLITAYDTTTYLQVAQIDLPKTYVQQVPNGSSLPESGAYNVIHWGTDGLAIPLSDGRVMLLRGSFVAP